MIGLLPYIDQILQFTNQSSSDKGLRKVENGMLIFWACIILGSISYALVVAGLSIYLMDTYALSVALCSVGLITLLTMLVLMGAHQLYLCLARRKIKKTFNNVTKDVSHILDEVKEKFGDEIKDNAFLLLAASAVAGYFLSRKVF